MNASALTLSVDTETSCEETVIRATSPGGMTTGLARIPSERRAPSRRSPCRARLDRELSTSATVGN